MTAPIAEDDLHALIDGQLSAARQLEVEAWLDLHPADAARVEAYRRQRNALREIFADVAEEPTPARLNVRTLAAGRGAWSGTEWRGAAVATLMLVIGGAAGWGLHGWSQPPAVRRGIEALAQEAAVSYAVYAPDVQRPIEIPASNRAALNAWVSQRIGRPVRAPDLSGSGFNLLGGRLVATQHGPAGMFLYQDEAGARVAMLVRPMDIDRTATMRRRLEGRTESYAWADDGLGYSVVSTEGSDNLIALSREVRRQARESAV